MPRRMFQPIELIELHSTAGIPTNTQSGIMLAIIIPNILSAPHPSKTWSTVQYSYFESASHFLHAGFPIMVTGGFGWYKLGYGEGVGATGTKGVHGWTRC